MRTYIISLVLSFSITSFCQEPHTQFVTGLVDYNDSDRALDAADSIALSILQIEDILFIYKNSSSEIPGLFIDVDVYNMSNQWLEHFNSIQIIQPVNSGSESTDPIIIGESAVRNYLITIDSSQIILGECYKGKWITDNILYPSECAPYDSLLEYPYTEFIYPTGHAEFNLTSQTTHSYAIQNCQQICFTHDTTKIYLEKSGTFTENKIRYTIASDEYSLILTMPDGNKSLFTNNTYYGLSCDEIICNEDYIFYPRKGELYGYISGYLTWQVAEPIFPKKPKPGFEEKFEITKMVKNGKEGFFFTDAYTCIIFKEYTVQEKIFPSYLISSEDKQGFINYEYNIFVEPRFDRVIGPSYDNNYLLVYDQNKWMYYIPAADSLILLPDNISKDSMLIPFYQDTTLAKLNPYTIDKVPSFTESYWGTFQSGKFYGIFYFDYNQDYTVRSIPPVCKTDPMYLIESEIFLIEIVINGENKWMYKTENSFVIIDELNHIDKKSETYIYRCGEKFGLLNSLYFEASGAIYDEVIYDKKFGYLVRIGDLWGLLNYDGSQRLPVEYSNVEGIKGEYHPD